MFENEEKEHIIEKMNKGKLLLMRGLSAPTDPHFEQRLEEDLSISLSTSPWRLSQQGCFMFFGDIENIQESQESLWHVWSSKKHC